MACAGCGRTAAVLSLVVCLGPAARPAGASPHREDDPLPRVVRAALQAEGAQRRWPRQPLLDAVTEAARVRVAWSRFGVLGHGAAVCVVDSGVDLRHHDFRDPQGQTRVRWMLDLEAPPRGRHPTLERRYGGAVWSAGEIDAALDSGRAMPGDPNGHGTAVASVAVGDDAGMGQRQPGPLAGVAPGASLIVVRALRRGVPGFHDADLIAGVRFCFDVSGRGERPTTAAPTVVVLGLGSHDGAHDGSEPLERALSEQAAHGRMVVAAAGNGGDRAEHAAASLYDGERATVALEVPAPGEPSGAERHVAVAVVSAPDSSLQLRLQAPDGTRTGWVGAGERRSRPFSGGRMTIERTGSARGDVRIAYVVMSGGGEDVPLRGGRYLLQARGPGRFDAWIVGMDVGATLFQPRFDGPFADANASVTIPATAPGVLAVGSITSRGTLETEGGTLRTPRASVGAVAPDSARGPTRTGAPKPDVAAPGGWMRAALSGDLDPHDPHNMLGGAAAHLRRRRAEADRIAVRGSSFSAAAVAGALALALGSAPSRGERERRWLAATARPLVDGAWAPRSGAGMVDVAAYLDTRLTGLSDRPASAARSAVATTTPTVAKGTSRLWLVARVRDARGDPTAAAMQLMLPSGRSMRVPVADGIAPFEVPVGQARVGDRLVYRPALDGRQLAPVVVDVRVDAARAGIGRPAGGCRIGPGRERAGAVAALAVAGVLIARRRPRRGRHGRRST